MAKFSALNLRSRTGILGASALPGGSVASLVLMAILILYILPAQLYPQNFFQDDSYFYLQVASNIVRGEGSTFHTITATNGYHPLWMVFCVLAFVFSAGDKTLALQVIVAIQALLLLGTAFYFQRLARLISLRFWVVGLPTLAGFFLCTAVYGSEAHLNAFLVMLGTYHLALALRSDARSQWIMSGLLLGLAILARLDNIFVAGSLLSFGVFYSTQRNFTRVTARAFNIGVPVVAVMLPYLVYNQLTFGRLMPISGAIKNSFPMVTADLDSLGRLGTLTLGIAVGAFILTVIVRHSLTRVLLRALSVGVVGHAGYVVLFTEHYTFWPWYYVSGVLTMALTSAVILDVLWERASSPEARRWIQGSAVVATALLVSAGMIYGWAKANRNLGVGSIRPGQTLNMYRWPNEFAEWMKSNLPPNSGVLAYDYPGTLAYFSDLRILPTDGLISDFSYDTDIVRLGIGDYLCEHDVDYYFGHLWEGERSIGPRGELQISPLAGLGQEIEVRAPLSGRSAGSIRVLDEQLVVRVRDVVRSPDETPPLAVWRLDTCSHTF